MAQHKITREFIRSIVATGEYQEFADADLRGFGVKVTPNGRHSLHLPMEQAGRRAGP